MTAVIRAIITDIEGTTTPIRFVHDVLFPYAARALPEFLRRRADDAEVRAIVADVAAAAALPTDASLDEHAAVLLRWMDEDRKLTPLKALQGLIWRDGYENGALTAPVYPDAAAQLARWHAEGLALYVYSSGSVQAQQLLFRHSDHGDLTPLFSGYFDTRTGPKQDPASYCSIATQIVTEAGKCLFLSDVAAELDAAAAAGMRTTQLVRPADASTRGRHPTAARFDHIALPA